MFNFLSALLAVVGVMVVAIVGLYVEVFLYDTLAFAAGGFIYIAGSDLVPELHKTREIKKSLTQILSISIGFMVMVILALLE